jgi:ornithine decarboxylase
LSTPSLHVEPSLPRYASMEKIIERLKPADPVYVVQPAKFQAAARQFLDGFAGDTLYAVKANATPQALDQIYAAGIRHFDTASLGEIELVRKQFPDAICHFMAPVRIAGHAKAAFEKYGVTDYVIDCDYELDKLIAETKQPKKLRIFVRLAAQLGGALLELSSKYGVRPEEGAKLLKRVAELGAAPCLTFHVGSQCLSPFSYAQAIEITRRTIKMAGIDIAALDIGGGFPTVYATTEMPPYHWYFDTIREALATLERDDLPVMCEPGRALVADGISVVTQVILRRGDRLYINDGIYGSFDEVTFPGFKEDYPPRGFTLDAKNHAVALSGAFRPFRIYGPTCDALDELPRPSVLPDSIASGDFIVYDAMGAYTMAARSNFNGFFPDNWVQIGG